jgi:hypothetical protein
LVVEGLDGEAEVGLNGIVVDTAGQASSGTLGGDAGNAAEGAVGGAHPTRFEITELLKAENVIEIVVGRTQQANERQDGFGAVRLEIEESGNDG